MGGEEVKVGETARGQDFAKIWPSQGVFRKGYGPTKEFDYKLGAGLMPIVQLEHTLYRTRVGQEGACDWVGRGQAGSW